MKIAEVIQKLKDHSENMIGEKKILYLSYIDRLEAYINILKINLKK
jgi:hypothetical protein